MYFLVLGTDKPVEKEAPKPKPRKLTRDEMLALRAEVRRCEERLQKIEDMRGKLVSRPLGGSPISEMAHASHPST